MTSSRSLLVIINDVLDLTKIEAGQLTLSSSDFNVRQVILAMIFNSNTAADLGHGMMKKLEI
jgi:signal transduction histidine kinase